MRRALLAVCCAAACAGPAGTPPQPMPDGPPSSPAAAAMDVDQPAQLVPGSPAPRPLSSSEMQRGRVEVVLKGPGYETAPQQVRKLGPGTLEALVAIYHDSARSEALRARALQALSYLDDDRARAELRFANEQPGVAPIFKRTALLGLGRSEGSVAVPAVASQLASDDPSIRMAAAQSLGRIGGPQARAALKQRLELEPKAEVRAEIARALAEASP